MHRRVLGGSAKEVFYQPREEGRLGFTTCAAAALVGPAETQPPFGFTVSKIYEVST